MGRPSSRFPTGFFWLTPEQDCSESDRQQRQRDPRLSSSLREVVAAMIDRKARRHAIVARVRYRRMGAEAPGQHDDVLSRRAREGAFDPALSTSNGTVMDVNLDEVARCIANAWPAGDR
jgi:hypothetical protein